MKKQFLLLSSLLLLVGCGTNTESVKPSEPQTSDNQTSELNKPSENPTTEKEANMDDTPLLEYEDEYVNPKAETSGIFTDLGMDVFALVTGTVYQGTVSQNGATDTTLQFELSEEGIISIIGDMSSITITALKAGGTILTIKNSQGHQLLTKAINVRDEKTPDELETYISENVRYFQQFVTGYDSYNITFTGNHSGIFYAKEGDLEYGTNSFTYKFGEQKIRGNLFYYEMLVTMDDDKAALKLGTMYLAVNGTTLIPFDNTGTTLSIFKPII